MTDLSVKNTPIDDGEAGMPADTIWCASVNASGYTTHLPVANLICRDDDPRYLTGDISKAAADFLEAGQPALTAYESETSGEFVLVVGAPYLPALKEAGFTEVQVTVYPYTVGKVLAHCVTPEPSVAFSRVDRAFVIDKLVEIFADQPDKYVAAAKFTALQDGQQGIKADQIRNYVTIADVARAHGKQRAEAFPTNAAPKLRRIARERNVTVQDLTIADLVFARNDTQASADASHVARIALQPYVWMDAAFTEALERASDEAAEYIGCWRLVADCLKAGVDAGHLEEMLVNLADQAAGQTPRVGGALPPQGNAPGAAMADTAGAPMAGRKSIGDRDGDADGVEDADFIDTPPHDAASATGGESSTGSRAKEPTHGASDTTCVMTGRVPVPVRSVTAASDLGTCPVPGRSTTPPAGGAVPASQEGTGHLVRLVAAPPVEGGREACPSTAAPDGQDLTGSVQNGAAAEDGTTTRRDRLKGNLSKDVADVRRFYELANDHAVPGDAQVPGDLQEAACDAVNGLAYRLGLIEDGQRFLRRKRLYEHACGREHLGTVELALMVSVCGSAEPVLARPRGRKIISAVCDAMRRHGLAVPADAEEAARLRSGSGDR